MKLLFLLTVFSYAHAAGVTIPSWEDQPMVVPATERAGHSYMIEFDTHGTAANSYPIFRGVAVAIHNNEILFAPYTGSDCVDFYSPRGGQKYCKHQFFLLQQDFARLKKMDFEEGYIKNKCLHPVKFSDFVLVFDKIDRSKADAEKYIGTYFEKRDQLAYWMKDSKNSQKYVRAQIDSLKANIKAKKLPAGRFEILCRVVHVY